MDILIPNYQTSLHYLLQSHYSLETVCNILVISCLGIIFVVIIDTL